MIGAAGCGGIPCRVIPLPDVIPRSTSGDPSTPHRERRQLSDLPAGGLIERLVLSAGAWTEFVPTAGIDAYLVQTPVTQGRIVRTSTATHPHLLPGAAVVPAHLERSFDVFPGQDALGLDVDTGVRFLFALVDAPAGSNAALLFERAV